MSQLMHPSAQPQQDVNSPIPKSQEPQPSLRNLLAACDEMLDSCFRPKKLVTLPIKVTTRSHATQILCYLAIGIFLLSALIMACLNELFFSALDHPKNEYYAAMRIAAFILYVLSTALSIDLIKVPVKNNGPTTKFQVGFTMVIWMLLFTNFLILSFATFVHMFEDTKMTILFFVLALFDFAFGFIFVLYMTWIYGLWGATKKNRKDGVMNP